MRPGALLCVVRGHRWTQPPDMNEAYPLFECRRCGRREEFPPGTSTPFGGRLHAETGRDQAAGPFGPRR